MPPAAVLGTKCAESRDWDEFVIQRDSNCLSLMRATGTSKSTPHDKFIVPMARSNYLTSSAMRRLHNKPFDDLD
jgi:hypothetical protein